MAGVAPSRVRESATVEASTRGPALPDGHRGCGFPRAPALSARPRTESSPGGFRSRARSLARAARDVARFLAFGGSLLAVLLARAAASPLAVTGTLAVAISVLALLESRRALVAAWGAYIAAVVGFVQLRALADETGIAVKYDYVAGADRALFSGRVPSGWLQDHVSTSSVAGSALSWSLVAVYVSYFVAPHLVALVLARLDLRAFARYAVALLAVSYAGLLISALVPTAPPWLAAADGRIETVTRLVPDLVGSADGNAYGAGERLVGLNPVAAFPSLHAALTLLIFLAVPRPRRWLRRLAAVYVAAMALALVYLGEHYAADVLAGLALALLGWLAVDAAVRRRAARPPVRTAAGVAIATGLPRPG